LLNALPDGPGGTQTHSKPAFSLIYVLFCRYWVGLYYFFPTGFTFDSVGSRNKAANDRPPKKGLEKPKEKIATNVPKAFMLTGVP